MDGKKVGNKKIKVPIPAGVDSGNQLKVPGYGETISGGKAGNLLVRVSVDSHPYLKREGMHIVTEKHIKLTDALLGYNFDLVNYDGKTLRVEVPASVQHGQVLRIKNKGVISRRVGAGDLLVVINIDMPKKLSKDARRIVEQLRSEGV